MKATPNSVLTIDEEIALSCAFRYALGRRTYVTDSVSKVLLKYKDDLPVNMKARIAREIQEYQDEHGMAGDECDNNEWNKVKEQFK